MLLHYVVMWYLWDDNFICVLEEDPDMTSMTKFPMDSQEEIRGTEWS